MQTTSVADLMNEIDRLRADNARLNKENDDWHEASKKLREEAATARLALDVATKEIEALRAKLKWFGDREPLIRGALGQDAPAVAEYELLNPKPGGRVAFERWNTRAGDKT